MNKNHKRLSEEMSRYFNEFQNGLEKILGDEVTGIYVHGSLALGGFNPTTSDVDLIVVVRNHLSVSMRKELAYYFLKISNQPYPLEISILAALQFTPWQFPTPYDFHYSEYWRRRYERELNEGTSIYFSSEEKMDSDLAAHFTILHYCGICLAGKPIPDVFPAVPKKDYIASLLGDYEECLEKIYQDPVYCILNLNRVYWYLKEGKISSKKEAGIWGARTLPEKYQHTIQQALEIYKNEKKNEKFNEQDLWEIKEFLQQHIEKLLDTNQRLSN